VNNIAGRWTSLISEVLIICFVVAGAEILSENTYSQLLAQNNEIGFPKCMAWYPRPDKDYLVAVGKANGNILLTSLDPKVNDELIGREFGK